MKETITKLYLELSLIVPKGTKTLRDLKNEEQIAALRADVRKLAAALMDGADDHWRTMPENEEAMALAVEHFTKEPSNDD